MLSAWSAGIMAGVLLSPLRLWLALGLGVAIAVVLIDRQLVVLVGLSLAALLIGAGRGALSPTVELPPDLAGQVVSVAGVVDDDPVERKGSRRLTVRLDHIAGPAVQTPTSLRVEVTVYGTTAVHYGDLVLLTGELQDPPRFDQFDYKAYLADQGIAAVMPSARLVRVTAHDGDPLHTVLFAIRHAVIEAVDRALPEPQAALVLGVVFGYRAALPPLLQQQMIASGLIHIVVISGLKVSLLARILHQAIGRPLPRAAPPIAVAAMVGYALFAGASAAALRAAAMGVLVVAAGQLRRQSQVAISLALTAAVMLALKPDLARDVSFQLSFAGTIGIATMTNGIAARLGWLPAFLRDPFAATVAAEAATWPLMLANFHQVSLVAPMANALVLPLLPAVMVVGGGGGLLGALATTSVPLLHSLWSAGAWPALQAAGLMATWFRIVIERFGSLPLAAIPMPYFPPRWLAAAAIVNSSALLGIRLRQFFWQRRVWLALGAVALAAVALLLVQPDGRVHVYALDVGTGSAVLVRTPHGHHLLIDAGPDGDKLTQALGRAMPPTARGIDVWLVTGGRRTEIGAGAALLGRFQIDRLVIAAPDPWSITLRSLVQQAQAAGITVVSSSGPIDVDGVTLAPGGDERSWLIRAGSSSMAIVPPETVWQSLPRSLDGAIFTSGGPPTWEGPGRGFSAIQVSANSRGGLPVRAFLRALRGAPLFRTDRVGMVELVSSARGFQGVN